MSKQTERTDPQLSDDEFCLVTSLRTWVGGPYLAALTPAQKTAFDAFMHSLRQDAQISSAIH